MPHPVVSNRYLFLCSPPKIVLAFKPDSRATLRKVTPRSDEGAGSFWLASWWEVTDACSQRGRTMRRTLSRDKTSADRLRDSKNKRREGNNRSLPGRFGSSRIRSYLLYAARLQFASFGVRGRDALATAGETPALLWRYACSQDLAREIASFQRCRVAST